MNQPTSTRVRNRVTCLVAPLVAHLVFSALGVAAQTAPLAKPNAQQRSDHKPKSMPPVGGAETKAERRIVVSLADRKLALLEGDRVVKIYAVSVGAVVSPSPNGEFRIAQRLTNPTYYKPGLVLGPGKDNPLGTRWMSLGVRGLGIHGTDRPESIGKNASHGCIRLRNRDIEDLFARVQVGDRVSLIGERTEEGARWFGGEPAKAAETSVTKNETSAAASDEGRGER